MAHHHRHSRVGGGPPASAAQPSLSQSVRRLERELGVDLFVRAGRKVVLTHAGQAFLGPGRRFVREAQNVIAATSAHAAGLAGTGDVVAMATLAVDPLAARVGELRRRHPALAVRVVEPAGTGQLLAMVRDGRAELGGTETGTASPEVVEHRIGEQELLAVLPPGSAGQGQPLTLRDLAERPLVLGPAGASTRQSLERALGEVGQELSIAVEVDQREAVVPLVLAHAGATALPTRLAREAQAQGAVVRPLEPKLVRPVSTIHRRAPLSPGAEVLLRALRSTPEGR